MLCRKELYEMLAFGLPFVLDNSIFFQGAFDSVLSANTKTGGHVLVLLNTTDETKTNKLLTSKNEKGPTL